MAGHRWIQLTKIRREWVMDECYIEGVDPCYIRVDHLVGVHVEHYTDGPATAVVLTGDISFGVRETPEEVMRQILDADRPGEIVDPQVGEK